MNLEFSEEDKAFRAQARAFVEANYPAELAAKQAKGSVKEAAGKVTGDAKLADKAAGKVQNAVGGVKDAVRVAAQKL